MTKLSREEREEQINRRIDKEIEELKKENKELRRKLKEISDKI